ncbi:MAG: TIGR02452 family protein [Clostridia bacterium]|nr:TIGR02452 family protein [Clostridia bacterium]
MNTYIDIENKAKNHIINMNMLYESEIRYSIDNSRIYRNIDCIYDNSFTTNKNIVISVVSCKTDDAVFMFNSSDNICVLNFASYKYPGGGFINGSLAQEESLCYVSTLYNVISSDKFKLDYEYNRNHTNGGLYEHFAIYSPNIVFENSKSEIKLVDVITCPAPNLSCYKGSNELYNKTLRERIKMILDIAIVNNVKTLILGAFGCGVFKNDPVVVVKMFKDVIHSYRYNFDNIVFAIPYGYNHSCFNKIF